MLVVVVWSALSVLTVTAAATCNFLLKWGVTGSGSGQFITPRGIAVDSSGNVYVPDQNTRVQKFDSSGTFIVDSSGTVYVADTGNNGAEHFRAQFTRFRSNRLQLI